MEEFPNNSHIHRGNEIPPEVDKQIEKIISGEAVVRRPSGMKRFRSTFIAGDSKTVGDHVFWGLLVPAIKDAVVDMGQTFVEMMILGDRRPGGRMPRGQAPQQGTGSTSRFNYNGFSSGARVISGSPQNYTNNEQTSVQYSPNEVVVPSRAEAEGVLQKLYELLDKYKAVTVADLYRTVGASPTYMDDKWGWVNLEHASYKRVRDGILIVLPSPGALD